LYFGTARTVLHILLEHLRLYIQKIEPSVQNKPTTHSLLYENKPTTHSFLYENKSITHSLLYENKPTTHTLQSKRKMQNLWSLQEQNRQFTDHRDDSTRTMIVDKFYHFHHHRGSVVMSAQWANVLYKPTCTKYLGRTKFALKINANVVIVIACGIW
jgi:hypothetical protein